MTVPQHQTKRAPRPQSHHKNQERGGFQHDQLMTYPPQFPCITYKAHAVTVIIILFATLLPSSAMLRSSAASPTVPTSTIEQDPQSSPWSWPIVTPHAVQRPFEAPANPYTAGHRGIDLPAPPGSPIMSPAEGTVFFTGIVIDRPVITIEHSNGLRSSFEPVESSLVHGTPVQQGETIGVVAHGGHCNHSCIHFGVRAYGEYVSPLLFLGHIERAILLPIHNRATAQPRILHPPPTTLSTCSQSSGNM
jgi:murein DD-endopeptidase MepM/ murein hydrolase activator NlpD